MDEGSFQRVMWERSKLSGCYSSSVVEQSSDISFLKPESTRLRQAIDT